MRENSKEHLVPSTVLTEKNPKDNDILSMMVQQFLLLQN